jgi:hypothetical protein
MWVRVKHVLLSFAIGGLLTGCYCLAWLPDGSDFRNRLLCWGVMLSGPVFATITGSVSYNPALGLGWLGVPLVAVRLGYPGRITAWVAVAGVVIWLLSGLLTVLIYS